MSKKKKISIIISIILLVLIIVLIALYLSEERFRNWVDVNILGKNITEEDIVSIDLNIDKMNQVYVYDKYIALLNNQTMTLYNNYGQEITTMNVNINNALFDANNKYLAIAENGGTEICLILDKTYLWSSKVEGEIFQIHVNRNGYVAVITKDSTYKSILTLYNSDGTALFTSFFASTRIIDASISEDNKYVAIGEIDSSGTLIQSNIKIISVENAKNDLENAIIYTYNAESGRLLTKVKYQSKGQIACMYDDSINVIQKEENKELVKINQNQITFMSVNLNNHSVYVEEENTGVFTTNSYIKIINTQDSKISTYNLEEVPKELYAKDEVIAVNVGTEIYFLNCSGKLIRKYSTDQEITNVIFSNELASIVYKDKVVLIDL